MKDMEDVYDPLADRRVARHLKRLKIQGDLIDLFQEPPPAALLTDYVLDEAAMARVALIQTKYAQRARNIRRSWNRMQLYFPELVRPGAPSRDVLELSTAHGGMLEVARHFGHTVMGSDYANMIYAPDNQPMAVFRDLNDPDFVRATDDHGIPIGPEGTNDWPYRPIIESIGIPMTIFDGGKTPYPFADKSQDVVMCFQAIEHYCHPADWMGVVAEMCRISRRTVFVMLNPAHARFQKNRAYMKAFHAFRLGMRNYGDNGFECTATFVHWNEALGFKLSAV